MRWAPILDHKDGVSEALGELNTGLADPNSEWFPKGDLGTLYRQRAAASLAHGYAGICLYSAFERAQCGLHEEYPMIGLAQRALRISSRMPLWLSLFEGNLGTPYASRVCEAMLDSHGKFFDYSHLESFAYEIYHGKDREGVLARAELCYGTTGVGEFFRAFLPAGWARRGCEWVVQRLDALCLRESEFAIWRDEPGGAQGSEDLPPRINLGMAHGVSAVLAFLSQMHHAGIAEKKTEEMIRGSVQWLLSTRLDASSVSFFPEVLVLGQEPAPSRLRWCYGDLPVAAALWTAGVSLGESGWRKMALEVFCKAAKRPIEQSGIVGFSLCHGLAGVAHMFNRAYQVTGEAKLRAAARRWFLALLEQREPGKGIGGWTFEIPGPNGKLIWPNNPGLLYGAAGVGLALLAAISDQEPLWDRCMLLDLPPAPEKQSLS